MGRRPKYPELTDEMLERVQNAIYLKLKGDIKSELVSIIKENVAEFVGSLLDYPLTVKQTAKLTGRSEDNIYKMCRRGRIPYTKIGTQIHINLRDINSVLILVNNDVE